MINRKPIDLDCRDCSHFAAWGIAINNSGQIVGNYTDTHGTFHGFLYSNGTYTTLDDPSTGHASAGGVFPADVDFLNREI
jgi:probable HAF family extracellular repeat protein